jgi:hypothetical protein
MWTINTCPDKKDSLSKTFFVTDVLITDTSELSHPFIFSVFFYNYLEAKLVNIFPKCS